MEQEGYLEKQLRVALKMAKALEKEAKHFSELPPELRPEKLVGAGKQFNELVSWTQQELGVKLPFTPLPDDPTPEVLSLAAAQLVGALQGLAGEGIGETIEEHRGRKREPILRIREQKSPVEYSELVITSAEELAELLKSGFPEWIKNIVAKATGIAEKAASKTADIAEKAASKAPEETEKQTQVFRVEGEGKEVASFKSGEQIEELGELVEELTEEIAEVEGELAEAAEEGYLTEDLKAQLESKKARLKQKLKEVLQSLQTTLGE